MSSSQALIPGPENQPMRTREPPVSSPCPPLAATRGLLAREAPTRGRRRTEALADVSENISHGAERTDHATTPPVQPRRSKRHRTRLHGARPPAKPQLHPKTPTQGRPAPNKRPVTSSKAPRRVRPKLDPKISTQGRPNKSLNRSPKRSNQTKSGPHKAPSSDSPKLSNQAQPEQNTHLNPKTSKTGPAKALSSSPEPQKQSPFGSNPKITRCTQSGPSKKLSSSPMPRKRGRPRKNPQLSPQTHKPGPNNNITLPRKRGRPRKCPSLSSSPTSQKQGPLSSAPNHHQPDPSHPLSSSPKPPERGRAPHDPSLTSSPQIYSPKLQDLQISPVMKAGPKKRVRSQEAAALEKKEQEVTAAPPLIKRHRKEGVTEGGELSLKQPVTSFRTRFEKHEAEPQEPVDELSSDLSIELSVQEDQHSFSHCLSLEEEKEDEEEDEEELPSFLQQISQKPSIREGLCVWCKLRKYPFWPAVVKSVNRKSKKASIVFIDQFLFDQKRICKGLSVSLRTLKPFNCEESNRYVDIAKQRYGKSIMWCLELISDYRISIASGSFAGSIIEYIANDISYPLRSKYCKGSSDLLSPAQSLMEQQGGDSELQECDAASDDQDDFHFRKKVLPDRAQAARTRANQRLVDFILRGGAEPRLLGVISRQEPSKWLQDLQSPAHHLVGIYLEDEEQVENVYRYLEQLCKSVPKSSLLLENTDPIPFILDVLFPEALIYALTRVDGLSPERAEEKFRQGPLHSKRERQEFDRLIEQEMKRKNISTASSS